MHYREKNMDLVRFALLVVLFTFTSIGASVAQTSAPPTYGSPYTFEPWHFASQTTVPSCQNYATIFGDPEPTIDDAAQAYADSFDACVGAGSCDYTYTAEPFGYPEVGYIVLTQAPDCYVAGNSAEGIHGSLPNQNPGANSPGGDGEGGPPPDSSPNVGDPIDSSSGNKYQQEDDYPDNRWLTFRRFYNSISPESAVTEMGLGWRHSFDRSLTFSGSPATRIILSRPDGSTEFFTKANGVWTTTLAVDTLTELENTQGVATGYTLFVGESRNTETYDSAGKLLTILGEDGQGAKLAYSTSSTPSAIAPRPGLLLSVTDPNGRELKFTYTSYGYINQITLPDGGTLQYAYTLAPATFDYILVSVTYPNTKTRQYFYTAETSSYEYPPALEEIRDEAGNGYAYTNYDSYSRADAAGFYDGPHSVGTTQITYNSDGTSTVQYPLGQTAISSFSHANGINEVTSVSAQCGLSCAQPWRTHGYDANGFPASYTDFNGNTKTTQYSASGLLETEVDGSGSVNQRSIVTTWNNTLRKPLSRVVKDASGNLAAKTDWIYNTLGDVQAKCEVDSNVSAAAAYTCSATGTPPAGVRRWVYTYCMTINATQCPIIGLLLQVNGPRTDVSDVTKYAYYLTDSATSRHGDLESVTEALGLKTTFVTYDGAGRLTRSKDVNGVLTDMTYTPRGWLSTKTVRALASGAASPKDATTTFGYTAYGKVASITDPDGVTTSFQYDQAHRLTGMTDAQGNTIVFTLDAAGNRTNTTIRTASGTTTKASSTQYNALGQITAVIDGLNHTVLNASYTDSHDGNGNLTHSSDALGFQREFVFDALNRLSTTIANYNGADPATSNSQTALDYDALNRLDGVADPDGLDTVTTYDGLGDRTQLSSPDTGTSTDTYDAAGNRLTHTDARGVASTSTYDALNRRLSTSYADSTLNVTYSYDEANTVTGCTSSKPKGRLTRVIEGSITTVYCYSPRGKIVQKRQITASQADTTSYAYTLADRLSNVTTPDNTVITYAYNSDGQSSSVKATPSGTTSAAPTVVSAITWLPFGPISSYTLGNGQTVTRTYDTNYALTDLTSPAFTLHLARDAMGNVVGIGNSAGATPATETYSYDPLYRLAAVTEASGSALESYTYDKTGDRLSKTATDPVTGAGTYSYTTGTHQLVAIGNANRAHDTNGNTTGSVMGGNTYGFGYNARNRLAIAQLNGATVGSYTYNALGERIGKLAGTTSERYAYNEAGQLIGEYGTTSRDYVWLGDLPVAVINNTINGSVTTSVVNYVTADQLGTPRAVSNGAGTVIWSWAYAGNPFGEQPPTSTTGYVLNLRYPGQYYDAETNTDYNYFRNYEPATGRYLQSDPLGLVAGNSTYAFVDGEPLDYTDSTGRCPWCVGAVIGAVAGGIAGYETGGWEGALIGGTVGAVAGAIAPWASAEVGVVATNVTGSILAGQATTVATLSALDATGAVAGTIATNAAEDQPLSQGLGDAAAIGAVAPIAEGVALANGAVGATADLMSAFSGLNVDALTASTLPIPPTIRPAGCQ